MRNFFIYITVIFSISAIPTYAQDQCELALSQAETEYRLGRLYEIPEMLQPCINDGFTKEERIRAYRLLTLTYLFLDYYDKADVSYLELLRLSPEYQINPETDPQEIINHHNKFTTKPVFYLTMGKVGVNFSYANVLLDYSLSQSKNGSDMYSSRPGFEAGIGAEMVIYGNLHLSAELFYKKSNIHVTDTHWDFYTTDMDFSQSEFELPLMLKYNFFRGKVNPFVSAGISPSYLTGASVNNIQGFYKAAAEDGTIEEFPVQPNPDIGTTQMKNKFNYSALVGAGINYKIGLNYLVFEARYSMGMQNVTDINERWLDNNTASRDLKFPTGQVYDDYKINNISVFVGFVKPLYKPRKIK